MKHLHNKDSCDLSRSPYCLRQLRLLIVLLISMALGGQVAAQIYGVAPVQHPTGGFAVDGNGFANYTVPDIGDWFDSTAYPGTGGTVFNMTTDDLMI